MKCKLKGKFTKCCAVAVKRIPPVYKVYDKVSDCTRFLPLTLVPRHVCPPLGRSRRQHSMPVAVATASVAAASFAVAVAVAGAGAVAATCQSHLNYF